MKPTLPREFSHETYLCPDGLEVQLTHLDWEEPHGYSTLYRGPGHTARFTSRAAAVSWILHGRLMPIPCEDLFATEVGARPRSGSLPHGQLWQPCRFPRCTAEPVCVNCEYCAEHCGCFPTGPQTYGGPQEPYGGDP